MGLRNNYSKLFIFCIEQVSQVIQDGMTKPQEHVLLFDKFNSLITRQVRTHTPPPPYFQKEQPLTNNNTVSLIMDSIVYMLG